MKSFFKSVLANIVAILVICVVGFIFLIAFIGISMASKDAGISVKDNSILALNLKTHIIDSPNEEVDSFLGFNDDKETLLLFDVLQAIEKAKTDEQIKGISIETDEISAGITQLDDIRAALEDFKKSGKFVLTYANTASQATYYLGSVANEYYLHPAGGIDLKGLSTEVAFFKDFAEKYGIGLDIIRHGKYKSAVEPYLRNDLSPENKEQLSAMLNDIWGQMAPKMSASRKIALADFQTITDSLYSYIPDNNIKYGLADKLIQRAEYDDILRAKLKIGEKDKINKVPFSGYINSLKKTKDDNRIGILYASGAIYNGEGYDGIYSTTFIKDIKKLAEDKKIKAVVLRINSPGGSANASDEILFELSELKKKKPLIVSFGDYAASGGYYIAMAGDKIYSEPNTLTGSIGVFGVLMNAKELANRNGIHSEVVSTHTNSHLYSPLSGFSKDGQSIITKSVEQTYKRFVHFVTENRKMSFEQVDEVGGGRVWSGTRAKEIGLVDELGTLSDALAFAAKKANIKTYQVVSYPKEVSPFEKIFGKMNEEEISTRILKSKLGKENYKIYEQIAHPKIKGQILMETPYEISIK